jgi:hypothetical protein
LSRGRKRSHEGAELGLSIYFDNLATAQQAKGSWINLGWQHDGTVGFSSLAMSIALTLLPSPQMQNG